MKYLSITLALIMFSAFAQAIPATIEEPKGDIILKDKDGKDLKITKDSKLEIDFLTLESPVGMVLNNEVDIKITADKQVVILKAQQAFVEKDKKVVLGGDRKSNQQDFDIQCTRAMVEPTEKDKLEYVKTNIECLKTNPECKAYLLSADKKFNLVKQPNCIGKKEVEISKTEMDMTEKIRCAIYKEKDGKDINHGFILTALRSLGKEKHIKKSTATCS